MLSRPKMGCDVDVDPFPAIDPALLQDAQGVGTQGAALYPLDQTFLLHSVPGAHQHIYLDFDGQTVSGTMWNSTYTSNAAIVVPTFTQDSDPAFSDAELASIQQIWRRVVEDYLPFNVDVSTQDPGTAALTKSGVSDTDWGIRTCIGGNGSWIGPYGGIAYVGSFTWPSDTPVFVFSGNLGNGDEKYTAEGISHEVGHSLGLSHDGLINPVQEYYYGQGGGQTGWAPIMGVGYYQNVSQWSKGEYAGANNQQDDLAIITGSNGFGYRADDRGSTDAAASPLTVSGSLLSGAGIIERSSDIDVYSFTTQAGLVNLNVQPWASGPDLDVLAELYDSSHTLIATSNPPDLLSASFNLNLPAGTYYLRVRGTGAGDLLTTGYSNYASLGSYTIGGTFTSPSSPTISIADPAAITESGSGTQNMSFTVSLSSIAAQAVIVNYATVDGTATAGSDYLLTAGTLTIPAGQTSGTINVPIVGDLTFEPNETFSLQLSNPTGGTITTGLATGTILNDDSIITGSGSSTAGIQNLGGGQVSIILNGQPLYQGPASAFSSVQINSGDVDDTLTLTGTMPFPVTFNGGGGNNILDIVGGNFTFGSDMSATSANLVVNISGGGAVTFGSTQHLAAINIADGSSVTMAAGTGSVLVLESLSIGVSGRLNLHNSDLLVGTGAVASVRAWIVSGYNGGWWTGSGIYSDLACNQAVLGYAAGNDANLAIQGLLDGQPFDADSVIVRFTRLGDANLDLSVDGSDVALWAQSFTGALGSNGASPANWSQSDWNYDGSVDGSDVALWAAHFTGAGALAPSGAPATDGASPSALTAAETDRPDHPRRHHARRAAIWARA